MSFEHKIALITGASRGIGECTARRLAREGCTVIVTDTEETGIHRVVDSLEGSGHRAAGFTMDVTRMGDIHGVITRVVKEFGGIDILVHCAGIYKKSAFLEMTEEEFDETIRVNLKGTFLCCQRVAREMVARRYGRIICMSSIGGQRGGSIGHAHYGAAKGGVIAMCKTMAHELGPFGITVNTVAPGIIKTEMTRRLVAESGEKLLQTMAVQRFGEAEDVAGAVLFLASREAGYITGATLDVNGGILMR